MTSSPEKAVTEERNTPHLAFVSEAKDYINHLKLETISADKIDFSARMMFMQIMHKTYAATSSFYTGVASVIPGTIINDVVKREAIDKKVVRIGHPAGIIPVEVDLKSEKNELIVKRAAVGRTSWRIIEGYVYVPNSLFYEIKS